MKQDSIRAHNKRVILEFIRKHAPASIAEIAVSLGLSATSVGSFITELTGEEKIIVSGERSTGGRKSALYRVNPTAAYFIGIDLQVDRFIGVLMDFSGAPVVYREIGFDNKDEWYILGLLTDFVQRLCQEHQVSPDRIGGIGIGVPGIVERETGRIEFAPNLGWKNVHLTRLLSGKIIPDDRPIRIENEANAAAWGEHTFGAAKGVANLVYVSVGMGVGCGLIFNGTLFNGVSNCAGEFGHMTVNPEGDLCRCGNRGCWELYASNATVLEECTQRTGKRLESYGEFIQMAEAGEPQTLEVLDRTIRYLATGIAGIVNGINPEMVVVGGEIAALAPLVTNQLVKEIKTRSLSRSYGPLAVSFSPLKDRAAALGVAAMVLEEM